MSALLCLGLAAGVSPLAVWAQEAPPPSVPVSAPVPPAPTKHQAPRPEPAPISPALAPPSEELRSDSALFPTPPRFTRRDNFDFKGAVDLRYRNGNIETRGAYVNAARFTGTYVRANGETGDERGGALLQTLLETDKSGVVIRRLRLSEAFVYYRFRLPGVSARIRAGQFVLPFGLAFVYDTPLQPIQPLYDKSIGLRVDTGVMLEGEYGAYRYAGSITNGNGPNRRDFDNQKVVSFRLSRNVDTLVGRFTLGGSLLSGRLPVTNFDSELPASGTSGARDFIAKSRFAADAQYTRGPLTLRGEIVAGADESDTVYGYFAEGNYALDQRLSVVAFRKSWNFPVKPQASTVTGVGANYRIGNGVFLRALYEYERNVPQGLPNGNGTPFIIKRLTLQTRLNF